MTQSLLGDIITIRGRFQRSVQLTRDWQEQDAIQDYLLTPTAQELALQITRGAIFEEGSRSWSITGPYGSGKSAFALFLTDMMASDRPKHPEAQSLRRESGLDGRSFLPVLTVGQRSSLVPNLLQSLSDSLADFDDSLSTEVMKVASSRDFSDREAVAIFEQAAIQAGKSAFGGLLIIIDEFGKFLEYAAQHPDSADLLVMQDLAELAARSKVPIILLTILHSAFAEYLSVLDETRRAEWRKVQGRFTDVAFLEPPEQFLRLTGAAIEWKQNNGAATLYSRGVEQLFGTSAFDEARKRFSLEKLLPECAPLHPITALLLWPLFRSKLAQNERSLFAFLMDRGPYGFQEFLSLVSLRETALHFFQVDRLYDYVVTALGQAVFLGDRSRRWVNIEHACDRVAADAPPLAEAVVKVVGLLSLYGAPVGLRASQAVLEVAFDDSEQVAKAIDYLRTTSIIVYRRYDDAFALWEGSDVDLEAAYEEALRHVGYGKRASRLKRTVTLRPVVAKAHYVRKGTLRYFLVDVVDGSKNALKKALTKAAQPAHGRIVFVLTQNHHEREELIGQAQELTSDPNPSQQLRLFAFPKQMVGLENALQEIEAWTWILENVLQLQGDPVARQEVRTRISHARKQLQDIAGAVLGLSGYLFEPSTSAWVQDGQIHSLSSALDFQRWLSSLCDSVFEKAPGLHNELLNRENISSAAAAGRRLLIEAMVENETQPKLGIIGTPSEYSMYRSLLETGGFHRPEDGVWHFTAPSPEWQPLWQAMTAFLDSTESGRRPLTELIAILKAPPFGLREGPIPVLVSALLLTYRDQVALYEEGLFVPTLRIEVLERLTKMPANFEVQQFRLDLAAQEAFAAVGGVLRTMKLTDELDLRPDLLKIVKPLVVFAARLPEFTKKTKRVNASQATRVRDTLLGARDPYILVFEDLPKVVGVSIDRRERIPQYAEKLRESLVALQQAYPRLLDDIEDHIRKMFKLDGVSTQVRRQLKERAAPLVGYAGDSKLDLFVRKAAQLGDRDWRETLAPVVSKGIPPSRWSDHDVVDFQVRLRHLASDFVRLEELVAEQERSGASRILRIGVLDGHLAESREVISVPAESEEQVNLLAQRIREVLQNRGSENEDAKRVQLAALTCVAQEYLQPNEGKADE